MTPYGLPLSTKKGAISNLWVGAGVVSPRRADGPSSSGPCKSPAKAAGPGASMGDAAVKKHFPNLDCQLQAEAPVATNSKASKKRRLVQQHQQPPSPARGPADPRHPEPAAGVHDWHR